MARYVCGLCAYVYDEEIEGVAWADLPDDWACPICGSPKAAFVVEGDTSEAASVTEVTPNAGEASYLKAWQRPSDAFENHMSMIHAMAETGVSLVEPMRNHAPTLSWDEVLVRGAQLARLPLNEDEPVNTKTVIGPKAQHPLVIARRTLDEHGIKDVTLIITGGFRVSSDVIKALALGADVVALAISALMAIGCQQYRICHTGNCPVGITTQDPELRARLDVDKSAQRLANFMRVTTNELKDFARLTGHHDVHGLNALDLCTTNSEISNHTPIEHV